LFGFALLDAELLRQAEGRESVNNSEIYDLGIAAVLWGDHERRHIEHLRGGKGVNVIAPTEGFDQQFILGKVGEQAKLDLRIIGGKQTIAAVGDEGSANLPAELAVDRNVLQLGSHRRRAPRRGPQRIERSVQALRGG